MRIVCVICTELFVVNSHISVVNCGHIFHEECLFRWLKSGQQSCPQCRCKTSEKQIVKRLFLNESCDTTLDCSQLASSEESTVSKEKYLSLLNKLEECKNDLSEQKENVKAKSEQIEKKDKSIKDLTNKVTTLTKNVSDNRLLVEHLKRDLDTTERLKEQNKKNVEMINELNMKIKEYRSVESIYRDHDSQFNNEMKKYLHENGTSVGNLTTIVAQLVRVNVLLKEHADKQQEEKRLIRKKLLQIERTQMEKDKFITKKESEIKGLHEQLEKQHELIKQKDAEYENLKLKYLSLSKMCKIQSIRVNNLEKEKEESPSKRINAIFDNSAENSKENSIVKEVKIETNVFPIVNDTFSPKDVTDEEINPNQQMRSKNKTAEDSDAAFLPDIEMLEYKCSKKNADDSVEVISSLSTSGSKRKEKENEMSNNISVEAFQLSPLAKRRKNPFMKPTNQDNQQELIHLNEMDEQKQQAKNKLTLSQRVLAEHSSDDVVPIARPITNKRFNALAENAVEPKEKQSVQKNAMAYVFDGLGGRSKLYRVTSTPNNFKTTFNSANLMPKSSTPKFAPLPVGTTTSKVITKQKSNNLTKFKVSTASNIFN